MRGYPSVREILEYLGGIEILTRDCIFLAGFKILEYLGGIEINKKKSILIC